jgi:LPS export ABC transporter protein LptC
VGARFGAARVHPAHDRLREEPQHRPHVVECGVADQEVSDFVLTETDEGHLQWKMFARSAATYSARNIVVAQGVRVDFFDEAGKQSSELTANEGEIHEQTRDMVARGNVVLQTTEGTRMSTQKLRVQEQAPEDRVGRVRPRRTRR